MSRETIGSSESAVGLISAADYDSADVDYSADKVTIVGELNDTPPKAVDSDKLSDLFISESDKLSHADQSGPCQSATDDAEDNVSPKWDDNQCHLLRDLPSTDYANELIELADRDGGQFDRSLSRSGFHKSAGTDCPLIGGAKIDGSIDADQVSQSINEDQSESDQDPDQFNKSIDSVQGSRSINYDQSESDQDPSHFTKSTSADQPNQSINEDESKTDRDRAEPIQHSDTDPEEFNEPIQNHQNNPVNLSEEIHESTHDTHCDVTTIDPGDVIADPENPTRSSTPQPHDQDINSSELQVKMMHFQQAWQAMKQGN